MNKYQLSFFLILIIANKWCWFWWEWSLLHGISEDFLLLPSGLRSCSSWNRTLGRCLVSLMFVVLFIIYLQLARAQLVFGVEVNMLLKAASTRDRHIFTCLSMIRVRLDVGLVHRALITVCSYFFPLCIRSVFGSVDDRQLWFRHMGLMS